MAARTHELAQSEPAKPSQAKPAEPSLASARQTKRHSNPASNLAGRNWTARHTSAQFKPQTAPDEREPHALFAHSQVEPSRLRALQRRIGVLCCSRYATCNLQLPANLCSQLANWPTCAAHLFGFGSLAWLCVNFALRCQIQLQRLPVGVRNRDARCDARL